MVVCEDIGQIGVGRVQGDEHLILVENLDVTDAGYRTRCTGVGVLAPVPVDREEDVFNIDGFAVVELDILADVQDPLLGTRSGFPALRELGDHLTIGCEFRQAVERREIVEDADNVTGCRGIHAVGVRSPGHGQFQCSTLVRCFSPAGGACQAGCQYGGRTKGGGSFQELPPTQCAFVQELGTLLSVHGVSSFPLLDRIPLAGISQFRDIKLQKPASVKWGDRSPGSPCRVDLPLRVAKPGCLIPARQDFRACQGNSAPFRHEACCFRNRTAGRTGCTHSSGLQGARLRPSTLLRPALRRYRRTRDLLRYDARKRLK